MSSLLTERIAEKVAERRAERLPTPPVAREIRLAAGLTAPDLAIILGVSERTIQLWEAGSVVPQRRFRRAYSQALEQLRREAT